VGYVKSTITSATRTYHHWLHKRQPSGQANQQQTLTAQTMVTGWQSVIACTPRQLDLIRRHALHLFQLFQLSIAGAQLAFTWVPSKSVL
jgi:hypothetical protein